MISVCFQIFVSNVNRSQIDEMYNKTTIAKLRKLCSKVRALMSSLISYFCVFKYAKAVKQARLKTDSKPYGRVLPARLARVRLLS